LSAKVTVNEALVKINFPTKKGRGADQLRLSGVISETPGLV
jgi:hypothetical protein